MIDYNNAFALQTKIANWYFAIGFLTAFSFCFFSICGGIYFLRKSALIKQQLTETRKRIQSEQQNFESETKDAALKLRGEKKQSHGAKDVNAFVPISDRKYLPENLR